MRSAKLLLSAAALAVALAPLARAGKEGKTVTVVEKAEKDKVELKKGDTLVVKQRMQGGTGFSWSVAKNDDKVLKAEGKPTTEKIKDEKPRPGGPVYQVFKFQAAGAGESKLELEYKRPFEKGKAPAKTFKLTVTVK